MNAVIIRPAELQDREALCRLYHEFHQFHVRGVPGRLLSLGDPPGTYEHTALYQTLADIIDKDDAAIFLAESAGQPLGLAEVYLRRDEPNPRTVSYRHGHLQSLIVTEACRRRGIGTRLLAAAESWARGKGAAEMRLETWEFEGGPSSFYQKNNYRTLRRTWIREL